MTGDNPAARLLAILEAGEQMRQDIKCRDVWRNLLDVSTGSEALLVARLGKAMELPEQAVGLLNSYFPNHRRATQHWSSRVNRAFAEQNLNSQWGSFWTHIDGHTLDYLRLAADLIETQQPTQSIAAEDLGNLRAQVDELLTEVIDSDLEPEIKNYLARYLRRIVNAIDEYRISGAVPILNAVEATYGHVLFDEPYRTTIKSTELGKKVVAVLNAVAATVNITVGLSQIAPMVQHLLQHM